MTANYTAIIICFLCCISGENVRKGALSCRELSKAEMKSRGFVVENKNLRRIFKYPLYESEKLKACEGTYVAIDTSLYLPWLKKQLQKLLDK